MDGEIAFNFRPQIRIRQPDGIPDGGAEHEGVRFSIHLSHLEALLPLGQIYANRFRKMTPPHLPFG